ncbi:2,3-bisphosphoglycerate-independent phosphoglycerate mutase [Crocinitomix catalasitica]|uniref:2,3-bisphosphoglycerate-independent phosphoglycerate mutase n=1 Tax=Crocinitomix catalasitica TaxID=184607 RepID=UPI0005609161|nr:2,3-bisphosphoglycerate-independent phosphoglycerate mutase [Crocinitomix catalasitica]
MNKKVGLIILDGWGHGDKSKSDGIFNANTPYVDYLEKHAPNAELLTHGEHVGLPAGQMGNSEVGHLNIGAGRIVYQELTRINKSILDNEFQQNKTIIEAFNYAKSNNKKVHFIGLVSDGGVHSSIDHLVTLCEMSKTYDLKDVFIHAFTDGRDCNPTTGIGHLKTLEEKTANTPAKVASIIGRYYAMDRDNRWERIKQAYDLMIHGSGEEFDSAEAAISSAYSNGITDEFILPSKIGKMDSNIAQDDVVICFNFRTDRCREISIALTQKAFPEFDLKPIPLYYVTMTNYDKSFKHIKVVFEKANLINTLGEIVAKNGLSQLRIAETEKYPHVSFFFSGGQEQPFPKEDRILIPSPSVATYDLQPEMSAVEIKDAICKSMVENGPDFFCLNFANTDMVGHTGDYNAILKAAEVVDSCLKELVEVGQQHNYSFVIIADHGNSDFAINKDGSPNTAHSTNPVPVLVLDPEVKSVNNGTLRDVAPTILALLNIKKPIEMTGNILINK